jgi:zinc-binding alcohol dehydrogenase/oxidoreductase
MRAVQINAVNRLVISEVPAPIPAAGEVIVAIKAAALNRRDLYIKLGTYAGVKYPCIPGSDGAGVITALGDGVDAVWSGREVIINPSFDWGLDERFQGPQFAILGFPRAGTFAELAAIPVKQLSAKPASLSWEEAAALPLAGLTAWRALVSRAELHVGERVLVTGVGGGVALLALQFAVLHAAEVWVTSSSAEKIARAVELGARGGAIYTESDWVPQLMKAAGAFDVVIDSAGGAGYESLIDLTGRGGRVVSCGATRGNPPTLPLRKIFWRQISLLGTTMGSPADWWAMTNYVAQHRLKPVVSDVFQLERVGDAFELMERGGQFGKIVIRVS